MKKMQVLIFGLIILYGLSVKAQKTVSEATILYNISIEASNGQSKTDAIDGATSTVFIKGVQSRNDMVSSLGKESTIHDSKNGNAFILKEYSGQKLMITLTKQDWKDKNKNFDNIQFETTLESKTIEGYNCKKVIGKTSSGTSFSIYYTPDLILANKEVSTVFKNLPGLALEFEIDNGKMKFKYTLSKINFDPVLSSKFEAPKAGYRVMTYEENKKLKK